ncbi:MAG: DUF4139 domain-containing protein [Methanothrix sp.]|nr:DUF4139 domain-containing protein [Methanothrix sp.]
MKLFAAILMLLLCAPAFAVSDEASGVEATTAVTLPVDSVTIYPNGMMAVKRTGSLDVTEGMHKFVINVPEKADKSSVLLRVSNATSERVVYDANPVYTLNISVPGSQSFDLSYLMYYAASWEPRYELHLLDDSVLVKANAVVSNLGGEDLKNVRLKLVAGLPLSEPYPLAKAAPQIQQRYAEAAPAAEAMDYAAAPAPATGELETLYIFELDGRKDLVMDKEIGFPLFEKESPLVRVYTWDAYNDEEGPAVEEIRANNTLVNPWPTGKALLYRNDEYVSTIEMPYTPAGTNASIVVGPSADLKVESKLFDYNITENIKVIGSGERNHTVKETTEAWTYNLKIKSNLDRAAALEVTDTVPQEAVIVSVSPEPAESTATSLKWKLLLTPRQKTAINYTYQVITTESLDGNY